MSFSEFQERAIQLATTAVQCSVDGSLRRRVAAGLVGLAMTAAGGGGVYWQQNRPVRHVDYWCVPGGHERVPAQYREASVIAATIKEEDATWDAEMKELRRLIDEQKPREFRLSNELATTQALRTYVEKLLHLGEEVERSFVRMQGTASKLDELLKRAPAKFMAMAATTRAYAAQTKRGELKANYNAMADIWTEKARVAAAHQHDIESHLNSDLLEHLRERNLLLERLLTMLTNGLDLADLRGAAEFSKGLEEVVRGHEFLSETLRLWRGRLLNDPPTPPAPAATDDRPQHKEVTTPQVRKVITCGAIQAATTPEPDEQQREPEPPPAAEPIPAPGPASSPPGSPAAAPTYGEQLREQAAKWQAEMKRLFELVTALRPEDSKAEASVCLSPPSMYLDSWRDDSSVVNALRRLAKRLLDGAAEVEGALVKAKEAATALSSLLEQTSAPSSAKSDADVLRAFAAIARGDDDATGAAAAVLAPALRHELTLFGDLPRSLRDCTAYLREQYARTERPDGRGPYASVAFGEALRGAINCHLVIRHRLDRSWAKRLPGCTPAA